MDEYTHPCQKTIAIFLRHRDKILFLHRHAGKKVDPNKLSCVGGRVETSENFLGAAIRETREETGYQLKPQNFHFAGLEVIHDYLPLDWIIGVFIADVASFEIPLGSKVEDGQLLWLSSQDFSKYSSQTVDDLQYLSKDIFQPQGVFFFTAKYNKSQKIVKSSISHQKIDY